MGYVLKVIADRQLFLYDVGWSTEISDPNSNVGGYIPIGTILYVHEFKEKLHTLLNGDDFLVECVAKGVDGLSVLSFAGTIGEFVKVCTDKFGFRVLEDNSGNGNFV